MSDINTQISNGVVIRKLQDSDYPHLVQFFRAAYGPNTVFQNVAFLKYYLGSRNSTAETASLVAIEEETNQIVSHYGGLFFELLLDNKALPIVWGVNAYTLPEWRGRGINSQIVDYIHNHNTINGVIGMPFEAPHFYKKLGYHIFNKETLSRYVYILSERTFEVVQSIAQNIDRARHLIKIQNEKFNSFNQPNIIRLTIKNIEEFNLDFSVENIATTNRSLSFLKWRLFQNPYIDYDIWAVVENQKILAYTALREETLSPQNYKVSRIIDLYGQHLHIEKLVDHIKSEALRKSHIYIDFSAYGELYTSQLLNCKFTRLDQEDYCLLPLVTSPVENRPNHEFLVIQSKKYETELARLNQKNTYFTRLDADRDRIAKISQIKNL